MRVDVVADGRVLFVDADLRDGAGDGRDGHGWGWSRALLAGLSRRGGGLFELTPALLLLPLARGHQHPVSGVFDSADLLLDTAHNVPDALTVLPHLLVQAGEPRVPPHS